MQTLKDEYAKRHVLTTRLKTYFPQHYPDLIQNGFLQVGDS
jgi:hypothetical protein